MGSACSTQHDHDTRGAREGAQRKKKTRLSVLLDENMSLSNRLRQQQPRQDAQPDDLEPTPRSSYPVSHMASEGPQLTLGCGCNSVVPDGGTCTSCPSQSLEAQPANHREEAESIWCRITTHPPDPTMSVGAEEEHPLFTHDAFGDNDEAPEHRSAPPRCASSCSITSQEWRDHALLFTRPRLSTDLEPPCAHSLEDLLPIERDDVDHECVDYPPTDDDD